MLAKLPVAKKDAVLMFTIAILLIMQIAFGFHKQLAVLIAILSLVRAIYKWVTSPTLKTQVSQPIFKP